MKDEKEVQQKLEQVKQKYFEIEYKKKFSCSPENCVHNYRHEDEDGEIGLCMLGADSPEEWAGNVCDDEETAKKCPFFELKHDRDRLRTQFFERLERRDVLVDQYKDIAALKWVLEQRQFVDFTWWSRFQLYMLRLFLSIKNTLRV
jgi:hypothetical protein